MSLLAILYWVILVLCAIGGFLVFTYAGTLHNVAVLVLFILIGLKIFRTPIQ